MRENLKLAAITSLICLVLVLVVGEIYLRNFSRWGYTTAETLLIRSFQYEPAVFATTVLAREAQTIDIDVAYGVTYAINEHGYRGEPFEFEKPDGTFRIIVYGGSSAFDISMADPNDWPHRIQALLRERGFARVEVINAGVPGHASYDSFGKFYAEGHLMDPDVVVMYNAWNDIKTFHVGDPYLRALPTFSEYSDPRLYYRNGVDRFLSEKSQVYARVRQRYYNWKVGNVEEGTYPEGKNVAEPAVESLRQFRVTAEMFGDLVRTIGAVPVFVTQARLTRLDNTEGQKARVNYDYVLFTHEGLCGAFADTDSILADAARATGGVFIDVSASMTGVDEYFHDHVHLTDEGSMTLARIIADELARIVAIADLR